MANGKINFGKQSGGTLGLVFPDGVTHTEVTLPESGTLATLASPAFTGTPTAPTQAASDNSTKVATTQYVDRKMTLMTAQNSASGTAIDFIGIPSWAKRITVMFNGVSTNGSSPVQIQLGTSVGIETASYLGCVTHATSGYNFISGFVTGVDGSSTYIRHGRISITSLNGNTYCCDGTLGYSDSIRAMTIGGTKTLSGVLDRIRITTVNGTDTFDAGSINVMYEG